MRTTGRRTKLAAPAVVAFLLLALGLWRPTEASAQWVTDTNAKTITTTTDKVGVGTNAPQAQLEVAGSDTSVRSSFGGMTGRVKVKVDATRGAIRIGDLIVTSGVEGVAMRSVPVDLGGTQIHRPGTIIGKALEPLAGGVGEILVLLSLQ